MLRRSSSSCCCRRPPARPRTSSPKASTTARTGWVRDEKVFTPANVGSMKLLWKVKLESTPRAMHNLFAPLIAERVTTRAGHARARRRRRRLRRSVRHRRRDRQGDLAPAVRQHADQSRPATQRHALSGRTDGRADDGAGVARASTRSTPCPGTAGCGRSISADGKDVAPPEKFIPGGGKPYALNLHNGVIYTATAQGCGGLTNAFYSFDLATPPRQRVHPRRRRPVGPPRRVDRTRRHGVPRHRRRAVRSADAAASATASSA